MISSHVVHCEGRDSCWTEDAYIKFNHLHGGLLDLFFAEVEILISSLVMNPDSVLHFISLSFLSMPICQSNFSNPWPMWGFTFINLLTYNIVLALTGLPFWYYTLRTLWTKLFGVAIIFLFIMLILGSSGLKAILASINESQFSIFTI